MHDLLALTVKAHGGMERWEQVSRFRAVVSIIGATWDLKGNPDVLQDVVLEGETGRQQMSITPFSGQGRQTIESPGGLAAAVWNFFTAPFIFARPDFVVEETEPWHEDGEVWRRLVVTYPDSVVAHCRQQLYYFDAAGLVRRLDCPVDILGGGPAVHYPSEYREFDGITVPTRRRVYVRNPDGAPVRDAVAVAIEVGEVIFR